MEALINQIQSCKICLQFLPFHPKPVLQASVQSKIIIIGQAPGLKVQNSGVPWDDLSGKELRRWLNVSKEQFYNSKLFALMPMGFCYPGKGKSGDLPPRPECAPKWHQLLLQEMQSVELIILIGQYAQKFYLKEKFKNNLTENVKSFKTFLPRFLPLVHPSPRNKIWQKKNQWFEDEVIPTVQKLVLQIVKTGSLA